MHTVTSLSLSLSLSSSSTSVHVQSPDFYLTHFNLSLKEAEAPQSPRTFSQSRFPPPLCLTTKEQPISSPQSPLTFTLVSPPLSENQRKTNFQACSKDGRSSFCSISPKPEFCKDFPRTCATWQQNAIPKRPRFVSSSLQRRREPSPDPSEPSAAALKHLSDSDNKGNSSSTEPAATAGT